jgi:ribose transport system substrate-binding protein
MKTRLRRGLAVLGIAALALSGCATSDEVNNAGNQDSAGASDGPISITLVAKVSGNAFWEAVNTGATAAGEELGVEVSFTGPTDESQIDKQADLFTTAINRGASAVAIAALDEEAITTALNDAKSKNIPVVAFDGELESDVPVATVATDNYAAGAEAARHMIEAIGGKGKVAVISHSQTASSGIDRANGFIEYVQENAPDIELLETQYCNSDQKMAQDKANAILLANPDLAGMYGTNDHCAVGAAAELETQNRTDTVTLIGFDSGSQQIDYIRQGVMAGAITQDPWQMGFSTVEIALAAINGETVEKNVDSGFHFYNKDNIDDEEIARCLYT